MKKPSKIEHNTLILKQHNQKPLLKMTCIFISIGGGELFDRVIEDEFVLTEKACAAFMRQIVEAVAYIHQQHIIHLDLKVISIIFFRYFFI
jgi:serine/threonine protein kinase